MKSPELLSPAGSLQSMRFAFAYGADAVYAGQPRYSLRARNNEFSTLEKLKEGIDEAHRLGKRFLLANNIAPHNAKIKTYLNDLAPVLALKPDALIMSDPGMMMLVRERYPEQEIHLSVQMNTVNYQAVKFWHQSLGIKRVILSRELSLKEIEEIKMHTPEVELEVFVHGSLCMAYSGRCLLSGYIKHRDPNQGVCNNACRNSYQISEATEDEWGNVDVMNQPTLGIGEPSRKIVLLESDKDPGKLSPMFEDEHGTYIMNSKDLRAIHHIEALTKAGVECFKIEGRTKSFFYAARTAQLYRKAIDDAVNNRPFDISLMDTLEGLANRGYTEGFFRRHVHDEYQKYENSSSKSKSQQFVGEVTDYDRQTGKIEVNVRNRFSIGDQIELMLPSGSRMFRLNNMQDEHGQTMQTAKGSGYTAYIQLDETITERDVSYAILIRHFNDAASNTNQPEIVQTHTPA
ncbi:tRNA 5-hydroxyuridine modification protein YegQ [Thiotrichales bacterium 19S3-7]|nr:tRNA 5-hydroxyuridine modification protein YegQ [Thiotrichales bacterium 19S3-7]MCF6802748.1 tRNA 5-hydroxyuridine modification protein YegQ [Thiotrichales bacterium 19S3-11]